MHSEEAERACEIWRRLLPVNPDATIADLRASFEHFTAEHCVPAPDVSGTEVSAGQVSALWMRTPGVSEVHTILYLHGGGYVLGTARQFRDLASRIGRAAGARVLVPEYRLAPEHPFPAAIEDAVSSYRWLLTQGTPAERIAIAGDSAGGGLTLATLLALRDRSYGDD